MDFFSNFGKLPTKGTKCDITLLVRASRTVPTVSFHFVKVDSNLGNPSATHFCYFLLMHCWQMASSTWEHAGARIPLCTAQRKCFVFNLRKQPAFAPGNETCFLSSASSALRTMQWWNMLLLVFSPCILENLIANWNHE